MSWTHRAVALCAVLVEALPTTTIAIATLARARIGEGALDGIAALGGRYAPELDRAALTAELLDPVRDEPDLDAVIATWEMSLESDFEAADTPALDGWLLGRTAARLCALVEALVADGQLSSGQGCG